MMGNNPKLDLVNVDVHTKYGQILSICSQDIERKQKSDVNQGLLLHQNLAKNYGQLELSEDLTIAPLLSFFARVRKSMTGNNPKLDLKRNSDVNQGQKLSKFCKKRRATILS